MALYYLFTETREFVFQVWEILVLSGLVPEMRAYSSLGGGASCLERDFQAVSVANYSLSWHVANDIKLSHTAHRVDITEERWCFLILSALIIL